MNALRWLVAFASCFLAPLLVAQNSFRLPTLVQTIPLPGVQGRIDHMDVDVAGQRLFLGALENDSLEVIDLKTGKNVTSLKGLGGPQGVAYIPETNTLYVAARNTGDLIILDTTTYRERSRLAFGDEADNLHYLPGRSLAILGYGGGGIAFLDTKNDRLLGTVSVGGHPEGLQAQLSTGRVFANVPNSGALFVFDLDKRSLVGKWSPAGVFSNYPLAVQESRHRGAYFTHVPSQVILFDTLTGRTLDQKGAPADIDDLFFDDRSDALYLVAGSGNLIMWSVAADGTLSTVGSVPTGSGARTGLLSIALGKLFVAVPARGNQKSNLLVFQVAP